MIISPEGMRAFHVVAHALTTVSTAGFSTSDSSLGKWDSPAIHWVAVVFILAGSLPFVLYVRLLRGDRDALWDRQVQTLLIFVLLGAGFLTAWLAITGHYGWAFLLSPSWAAAPA